MRVSPACFPRAQCTGLLLQIICRSNLIRVFQPLRYRNYALFWSSDLIASIGQFVREVALYWLAYEITGSAYSPAFKFSLLCSGFWANYSVFHGNFAVLAHGRARNTLDNYSQHESDGWAIVLRDLVPEPELMSAVSLYSIGFNFARIAAYGLALTSVVSITLTALTFWRLLAKVSKT